MTAAEHSLTERFYRIRMGVVIAAVASAILAPMAIIGGALGVRAHLFSLHVGFDWLAVRAAPALALVGLALGVLGLIAALAPPLRGLTASLIAIALGALTFSVLVQSRAKMAQTPPVHDVSTDWTRLQLFSAKLMAMRGPLANPLETNPVVPQGAAAGGWAGQYVGVVNAKTCPSATPVTLMLAPSQAYGRAKAAVLAGRLALVTDDPAAGVIEATHTSPLFGFEDDVALSLRRAGAGTRIDMRASSRTGQSDFGRDCRLVTRLRALLVR